MFLALLALQTLMAVPGVDRFAFFQPSVSLTADDRHKLDQGRPVARIVPSQSREVAIFAAVPVDVTGDRLVSWMRRVEELKKSAYVVAIARFSDPPRIEDLAGLALDDEDLSAIRACRPGDCGLKLSADEITRLRTATGGAGAEWKPALQAAFRAVVLQRVDTYLSKGLAALSPNVGGDEPVWPATRFSSVLGHSVFLTEHVPRFAEHLARYPHTPMPEVESFVYWSKERLAGKPIISATHVSILRSHDIGLPDALVAGKEIFATHYVNASLGVTTILRGQPDGPNYLAYLNRSDVDVPGGVFGGLVRWLIERRLKGESAKVLEGLRHRLESGEPPAGAQE